MRQKFKYKKENGYLVLYAICIIVLTFMPSSYGLKTLSGLGRYLFLGVIGIILFHRALADQGEFISRYWKVFIEHTLLLVLGYIILNVLSSTIVALIMDWFHLGNSLLQNDVNIINTTKVVPPVVFIVFLGIIGPLVEELVFRYSIMNIFKEKLPYSAVILLQAVLFALVHVHKFMLSEIVQVLPHFIIGIYWGYIYHKTGNIWYSTIVHMITNTITFLILLS